MALWNFLLRNIKSSNYMFISLILNCDFSSYLIAVLFKKNNNNMYIYFQSYCFSKVVIRLLSGNTCESTFDKVKSTE